MLASVVKPSSGHRLSAPNRRRQILGVAIPVFARAGYAGATTRAVAAAAGVTEPVLYRHFADKAALFRATLREATARLTHPLGEAIAGAPDARGRIEALAAALPGLLTTHPDELRILCGAAASHADAAQTAATRAALQRLLRLLGAALQPSALRPGVDTVTAASFLLQVGLGAVLLRPAGLAPVERQGFSERIVAMLTTALLRPERA